jgi:hypothetical protein
MLLPGRFIGAARSLRSEAPLTAPAATAPFRSGFGPALSRETHAGLTWTKSLPCSWARSVPMGETIWMVTPSCTMLWESKGRSSKFACQDDGSEASSYFSAVPAERSSSSKGGP